MMLLGIQVLRRLNKGEVLFKAHIFLKPIRVNALSENVQLLY